MGLGMPEVDHQSVAEELGDMALVALDDRRAGSLVGADDLAEIFGVQARRQRSGAREVAEHDGDLAALAIGGCGRRGLIGGGSLARQLALRAGQGRQRLAAAAAEGVVGLVEESATWTRQRQRLPAGRAESALGAIVDSAGGTFHGEVRRPGQPAEQHRGIVQSLAGPVQPRRLAQV